MAHIILDDPEEKEVKKSYIAKFFRKFGGRVGISVSLFSHEIFFGVILSSLNTEASKESLKSNMEDVSSRNGPNRIVSV